MNKYIKALFELVKAHSKDIANVVAAVVAAIITTLLAACSTTQKISVKQGQGEQQQETIIESDTQIKSFSYNYYNITK